MTFLVLALQLPGVEISIPPLAAGHWVLMAGVAVLACVIAWGVCGVKIRQLRQAALRHEADHAAALAEQAAVAASQMIEIQRFVDDAVADRTVLEQRFALHREVAQRHEKEAQDLVAALDAEIAGLQELAAQQEPAKVRIAELETAQAVMQERLNTQREADARREADAQARIAALESELAAAREISAQLQATKARIGDLEAVVASERGRKEALEKMITVTTQRAEDLDTRLKAAQQQFVDYEIQARQRQAALAADLAEREKANSADRAGFEKTELELTKLKETHASYQLQSEARIANLQRSLSAAEAKTTVVQKELMGAFGVLPAALPLSSSSTPDKSNEKRVRELMDRITQIEAEGRKKAREDSYKIAELEYRLLEAHEAIVRATGGNGAKTPPPTPPMLPPPTQNR